MDQLSFCRVCLKQKRNSFSLYLEVQEENIAYIIFRICGVLISSCDEPDALICKECARALIQADEIIQKCQESNKILIEQQKVFATPAATVKSEYVIEQNEKLVTRATPPVRNITSAFDTQLLQQNFLKRTADLLAMDNTSNQNMEIKRELQETPDLTSEDRMYVEPEMFVESILENSESNASCNSGILLTGSSDLSQYIPKLTTSIYSSTSTFTKPKKKIIRSREQYLKRKIRNVPIKEPLTLIGGTGIIRKRKPKTFHRAIPNFYFKCELCHEFESNVASYSVTHLNTVHQIERPAIFKCQLCDAKPFIKNQSLQEHVATIHQKQPKARDYLCTECGKSFIKNCHLQKHILSVHKFGNVKYKCEKQNCNKSTQKMHLQQSHSDEPTPFSCELCDKSFDAPLRLRYHMKSSHCSDVYNCIKCGSRFTNKMRYEIHVKSACCKYLSYACRYCKLTYNKKLRLEEHLKLKHHINST